MKLVEIDKNLKNTLKDHLDQLIMSFNDYNGMEVNYLCLVVEGSEGEVMHATTNTSKITSLIGALEIVKNGVLDDI